MIGFPASSICPSTPAAKMSMLDDCQPLLVARAVSEQEGNSPNSCDHGKFDLKKDIAKELSLPVVEFETPCVPGHGDENVNYGDDIDKKDSSNDDQVPCSVADVFQPVRSPAKPTAPTSTPTAPHRDNVTPQPFVITSDICVPEPPPHPATLSSVSSLEGTVECRHINVRTVRASDESPSAQRVLPHRSSRVASPLSQHSAISPQRTILWHGQCATVYRDNVNHLVEKEVSAYDRDGQIAQSFEDHLDLLRDEYTSYTTIGEHPNIVRCIRWVEEDDMAKLVLEDLCEQNYRPLFYLIERPPYFTPRNALKIVEYICEALIFIHSAGYVHGDLNLNNIMIKCDSNNRVQNVKIVDFNASIDIGAAGFVSARAWVAAESVTPPEADHTMFGSRLLEGYPEDYECPNMVSTASDMYSVGRLIWMLVERNLDIPSSVEDTMRELQIDNIDVDAADPLIAYIDSNGRTQPGALVTLQRKLVSMNPADRYTAKEALEYIQKIIM